MMTSETVRKIGFTGSTAVGKMLAEQAAKVGTDQTGHDRTGSSTHAHMMTL